MQMMATAIMACIAGALFGTTDVLALVGKKQGLGRIVTIDRIKVVRVASVEAVVNVPIRKENFPTAVTRSMAAIEIQTVSVIGAKEVALLVVHVMRVTARRSRG